MPVPLTSKGQPVVIPVALPELACFSSIRVYIPQDLRTPVSASVCLCCSLCWFLGQGLVSGLGLWWSMPAGLHPPGPAHPGERACQLRLFGFLSELWGGICVHIPQHLPM